MTNIEIWKTAVYKDEIYEGLYKVSNLGRVKSLWFGKEKVLKPVKRKDGYLKVILCKNNEKRTCLVHRLVASTFLENPEGKPEINHIDEDKENNRVDNLEWCDRKYNNNYGTHNERSAKAQSKIVLQLTLTGELIREWPSTRECGRNGFDQRAVSACCRGNTRLKTYKGFRWKYK